jgi:hypothetical protein
VFKLRFADSQMVVHYSFLVKQAYDCGPV